jgi:hypothetical protein
VTDRETLLRLIEESVLRAPAHSAPELRRAAAERGELPAELRELVDKIHRHAYKVTDEDMAALKGRYDEDQLFELVVAATFGAARERLRAGLAAVDEAEAKVRVA